VENKVIGAVECKVKL